MRTSFSRATMAAALFGLGTAMAAAMAGPASAVTLLYNDFSDLTGLQLNGVTSTIHSCSGGVGSTCSAVTDLHNENVLRLTNTTSQSGSAFSTTAISLDQNASFSTKFTFHFTDQQNGGADGIVFVLQTASNTAGGSGGGIGYQGIGNSVGVEFDNWDNGGGDGNSDNHAGINLNGNVSSVALTTAIPLLDSGALFTAWVDYDGVNNLLEVRANTTGIRDAVALLSYTVDLTDAAYLGNNPVFAGFTSGTGSAGADHDIVSWEFRSEFNPIDTPEPAALGLLGLGLIGLGLATRRRKSA